MSTCLETYATLRIFSESMTPDEIGEALEVDATRARLADPESRNPRARVWHGWFWGSKGQVAGTDNLHHSGAILGLLEGKEKALDQLRARGCRIDIICYWVSKGQGGPQLDSATLKSLAALDLPVWWDVYFGREPDYERVKSV